MIDPVFHQPQQKVRFTSSGAPHRQVLLPDTGNMTAHGICSDVKGTGSPRFGRGSQPSERDLNFPGGQFR